MTTTDFQTFLSQTDFIGLLSHYLTRDSVDFRKINTLVIGLPFFWLIFDKTVSFVKKFSFINEKKMVYPVSSDCQVIYDKNENGNRYLTTMYNNSEAIYLGKQILIYRNHHSKDMLKVDFVEAIFVKADKKFDQLSLNIYSDYKDNKLEVTLNAEKDGLMILPTFLKAKSFIKIEFEYHAESALEFDTKTNIVDGEKIENKLDWRYSSGESYASFSISFGNTIMLVPLIALIPTAILHFATILSFEIAQPLSDKIILNPLFIMIYILVFIRIFSRFRHWEKQHLLPHKISDWHLILNQS